MNTNLLNKKLSLSYSRPYSQKKRNLSETGSLKSIDKLYLTGDNGNVFSEKCLINQKNYLKFKGKLKSLKNLSMKEKSKKKQYEKMFSCEKLGNKSNSFERSKSGFFSSTYIEKSEKLLSRNNRIKSQIR